MEHRAGRQLAEGVEPQTGYPERFVTEGVRHGHDCPCRGCNQEPNVVTTGAAGR